MAIVYQVATKSGESSVQWVAYDAIQACFAV
jgi:hypothetical protein